MTGRCRKSSKYLMRNFNSTNRIGLSLTNETDNIFYNDKNNKIKTKLNYKRKEKINPVITKSFRLENKYVFQIKSKK